VESEVRAFFLGPQDLFLNFTLQIEAMCFAAGEDVEPHGLSERDIILMVLARRDDIARLLRTPKRALRECDVMEGVGQLVAAFMESPDWAETRREIGLR
jgi:hypothetical protein